MNTSKQTLLMVLINHWTRNNGERFQLTVQSMQDEIKHLTKHQLSTRQMWRLLLSIEKKGLITRHQCNREKRQPGTLSQVTFYAIPDIIKAFQFILFGNPWRSSLSLIPVYMPSTAHEQLTPGNAIAYYWRPQPPPRQPYKTYRIWGQSPYHLESSGR
jgi:hypothetical protein